ncbi:MAG: RT0821/Lpp0805 family surface protein [Bosea sp. (in: a-proteobacteria)]
MAFVDRVTDEYRPARANGEMRGRMIACAFAALIGALTSACSITMPLAGLDDEPAAAKTTASIMSPANTAPLPLKAEALKAHVANHSSPGSSFGSKPISGRELSARVSKPAPSFPAELGPEDLRRAHGAMSLALDPQGNGRDVSWSNPQSGMKGAIIPTGGPYLKAHEICRAFTANTSLQAGAARQQGIACRPSGGEWSIREMQSAKS